jgi:two-component sensor histidine kinase
MTESKGTILLVEDDRIDRMAFERFVQKGDFPYSYDVAGSLREAMDCMEKKPYDAVILDYILEDGTAFELFGKTRGVPIVIVTGTGDEEIAVRAMKSGAYDYLIKDADGNYLKTLPVTLEKVIRQRLSEKELARYREHLELLVKIRTEELQKEIEERRRAEEKVKASLKEKELLIKEIHHRVKNNMQIISSLLSLQAQKADDDRSLNLFKMSENRVRSMALVHENLFESDNLMLIDFDEYIRKLINLLIQSFSVDMKKIRFIFEVHDIFLNINEAIPCAQMINELVTNSIKYAFPGDRQGEIKISFDREDDRYRLAVSDDGVGLPEFFERTDQTSLGIHLVEALAAQLKGSMAIDRSSGTAFIIRF